MKSEDFDRESERAASNLFLIIVGLWATGITILLIAIVVK